MTDLSLVNPEQSNTSKNFRLPLNRRKSQNPVTDTEIIPQPQSIPWKNAKFLKLSSNLLLRKKTRMLYLMMDIGEKTFDGFNDPVVLTKTIPEADLGEILLLAPQRLLLEKRPRKFNFWKRKYIQKRHVQRLNFNSKLGQPIQRLFNCHDQSNKSIYWTAFSTKKQHPSGHATEGTQSTFLFHATQACRQHVL